MSTISLSRSAHHVNRQRQKFDRFANPSPDEIPVLWDELSTLGALVPPGESGGVHRLRTRLLDAVEPWRLPELLDQFLEATP